MNNEEIRELIASIQDHLAIEMNMPIYEIRQRLENKQFTPDESDNLINIVNGSGEYKILKTAMEAFIKGHISRYCSFYPWLFINDDIREELFQKFHVEMFQRCVIYFDLSTRFELSTYLYNPIHRLCQAKKNELEKKRKRQTRIEGKEPADIDKEGGPTATGKIYEDNLPNPHSTPEEIVLRMEVPKHIINFLDGLGNNVSNKLVYHCKKILPNLSNNIDNYEYLMMWQGESLETVSNLIEGMYSEIYKTKTVFMKNTLEEQLTRGIGGIDGNRAEDIFLANVDLVSTEGQVYINSRVNDIDDSFRDRNNRAEIMHSMNS